MSEITALQKFQTGAEFSPKQRRSRKPMLVGVLVAASTVSIWALQSFLGGPTGQGPAALAVQRTADGSFSIRVVDAQASSSRMTEQLRTLGFKITVETEPAEPQLVGRWVAAGAEETSPTVEEVVRQANGTSTIEIRPPGPSEQVVLYVGRPTRAGEAPAAVGEVNAASPGGLLYCYRLSGTDPTIAQQTLQKAGYTVHWLDGSVYSTKEHRERTAAAATPPPGVVTAAVTQDARMTTADPAVVFLRVTSPTASDFEARLWSGYPESARARQQRDYSSCPNPSPAPEK
jgi:hypothetical protein